MSQSYVTLDGYVIRIATEKAIGLAKIAFGAPSGGELTWLPRSLCQDGFSLDLGDTDITVPENIADEKGLDY